MALQRLADSILEHLHAAADAGAAAEAAADGGSAAAAGPQQHGSMSGLTIQRLAVLMSRLPVDRYLRLREDIQFYIELGMQIR